MKAIISPFKDFRWEFESEHIIWMPPIFSDWEGNRSVYITGVRGTGKTTLLKALEWETRLKNVSILNQLEGQKPFDKKYVGIYLNTPRAISAQFLSWPPKQDGMTDDQWEESCAQHFSLYLEYNCLQLFIDALQKLRGEQIFKFSPIDELNVVKNVLNEREEIGEYFKDNTNSINLNDLRLYFKKMHEKIRKCAVRQAQLDPQYYPSLQMGDLLEEVTQLILPICSINLDTNDPWRLKICIDQAESFQKYQQKAINTIIAKSESNVSFAIASLDGGIDIVSTYIPHHNLTDADRAHYSLGNEYKEPKKFYEFVSKVSELRIKKISKNQSLNFDLHSLLGSSDINRLIAHTFRKTESTRVRKFLKDVELNEKEWEDIFKKLGNTTDKFEDNLLKHNKHVSESTHGGNLHFAEYYLIKKLNLKKPDHHNNIAISNMNSAIFRQRKILSLLCLCAEYKFKVPYAGFGILLTMSDRSIRDYLRQMHEIFKKENLPIEKFVNKPISIETQNKALVLASKQKYTGISDEPLEYPLNVMNLIDVLGKLNSRIQSEYRESRNSYSLQRTEQGYYSINYEMISDPADRQELKDTIKSALDSNYISFKEGSLHDMEENTIVFRLHRLFAPKYNFSYRGPYKEVPVNQLFARDLLKLCKNHNTIEREMVLKNILISIFKDEQQVVLSDYYENNADGIL